MKYAWMELKFSALACVRYGQITTPLRFHVPVYSCYLIASTYIYPSYFSLSCLNSSWTTVITSFLLLGSSKRERRAGKERGVGSKQHLGKRNTR